jgi:hypothetical protein
MTQHSSGNFKSQETRDNKHIFVTILGTGRAVQLPLTTKSHRGEGTNNIPVYTKRNLLSVRSMRNSKLNEHKLRSIVMKTEQSFVSVYRVYSVTNEKYYDMDI